MKANIAGAHGEYRREDYMFKRNADVREPFVATKAVKVWPVAAQIINLALWIAERGLKK